MKYFDMFNNRDEVAQAFEEGTWEPGTRYSQNPVFTAKPFFPADEDILFAEYTSECYDGHAIVVFQQDGHLFEVNGSHCSCYGLEGQWEPERTSREALAMRVGEYNGPSTSEGRALWKTLFGEPPLKK